MRSELIRASSSDGLSLEAVFDHPDNPVASIVLCHPHPKMGGTMKAPLLVALRDHLVQQQWGVLRFNFRGIGSSDGESGTGVAEVADADGALAHASGVYPELPLAIAGWSFGGAVSLRAASLRPELVACTAIAPAIVPKPDITAGAPAPDSFTFPGPTLVVCGANDRHVSPAACRSWAQETGASYQEMKGANHFFWGKYEALAAALGDFLDQARRR